MFGWSNACSEKIRRSSNLLLAKAGQAQNTEWVWIPTNRTNPWQNLWIDVCGIIRMHKCTCVHHIFMIYLDLEYFAKIPSTFIITFSFVSNEFVNNYMCFCNQNISNWHLKFYISFVMSWWFTKLKTLTWICNI